MKVSVERKLLDQDTLVYYFTAESVEDIRPENARVAQADLGYHPQFYGFHNFKTDRDPVLMRHKATWEAIVESEKTQSQR